MLRAIAVLSVCCVAFCAALDTEDIIEVALRAIETTSRFIVSPNELTKWPESKEWQHCVEIELMDYLSRSLNTSAQCQKSVSNVNITSSGDDLRHGGSGSGIFDGESDAVSSQTVNRVFCSRACGQLILRAYDDCGLFKSMVGKKVEQALVDSCGTTNQGRMCRDAVAELSTALETCSSDDCTVGCKESLESSMVSTGCCLQSVNLVLITAEVDMGSKSRRGDSVTISLPNVLAICSVSIKPVDACKNGDLQFQMEKPDLTVGSSASFPLSNITLFMSVMCLVAGSSNIN